MIELGHVVKEDWAKLDGLRGPDPKYDSEEGKKIFELVTDLVEGDDYLHVADMKNGNFYIRAIGVGKRAIRAAMNILFGRGKWFGKSNENTNGGGYDMCFIVPPLPKRR